MQHPFQHSPAQGVSVEAHRPSSVCRGVAMVWFASLMGGCSLSFPIASMNPGKDDITASIKPSVQMADLEDRRLAQAALSTALDPQGAGTSVAWENPATGAKGSYTPIGHAYPSEAHVCRAFLGTSRQGADERMVQGTACTVSAGEWTVTDLKPFKKG